MLYLPEQANAVDGRALGHRLSKLSPRQRGLVALDLESGKLRLANLTRSQACAIAKVSGSTVARVRCPHQQPLTDAAVERAVKRLGPDRVLRVLDKLTAPTMQAAE